MSGNGLLPAALAYAQRGWLVFPLEPGGKRPLGRLAPQGLHNATTSAATIRSWWADTPDANIGIATGEASGLLVLDADGPQGLATLGALEAAHGALPHTAESLTGGGGRHFLFAYPKVAFARFGNTASRAGECLDTRGEGGYIVAPPSATEGGYEWYRPPSYGIAEAPAWLLDLLVHKPAERPTMPLVPAGADRYAQAALEAELDDLMKAPEGTRNNALNEAAFSLGQLVGGGLLDHATVEAVLVGAGRAIGLSESETVATVRSGMRAGQREPRQAPARPVERAPERPSAASNGASNRAEAASAPEDDPFAGLGVSAAASAPAPAPEMVSLADALNGYFDALEKAREGGTGGVATGFADLDRMTGGLKGGELVILAARPGVGKTALALNVARHAAGQGTGVLVVSAEMSAHQLAERLLAAEARVDAKRLREGYVDEAEYARVGDAFQALGGLPFWIADGAAPALADVVKLAGRAVAEKQVGLVLVDYVGLVRVPGQRDPRLQLKEVSAALKALARTANVPVLALSQLNRGVEGRENHTPRLSDLRESGDLEQDADVVLFLTREEAFDPDTDRRGIADLVIAKNRSGPTGAAPLRWIAEQVRFADLEVYRPDRGQRESI